MFCIYTCSNAPILTVIILCNQGLPCLEWELVPAPRPARRVWRVAGFWPHPSGMLRRYCFQLTWRGRIEHFIIGIVHTVYKVIFARWYFRPSLLANGFAPSWIRQDVVVFKERLFWDIGIRPFFNSSADNEDERGEKNIFLFIWILPHEINRKIWIACNIA